MTAVDTEELSDPPKKSKLPMILGVLFLLLGAGGGFFAVSTGMILGSDKETPMEETKMTDEVMPLKDMSYVALDPLVVSFGGGTGPNLRFRAQLEVHAQYHEDVSKLTPRVIDVLNSYLRAVDLDDIRDNAALVRLRAQMLRRVQVVTGGGRVNDLLIMEFVLN